jgi:hypothetical protein
MPVVCCAQGEEERLVAAIPLAKLGPEHLAARRCDGAGIKIDRAQATGSLHSRTVEKIAAAKRQKIRRLDRTR